VTRRISAFFYSLRRGRVALASTVIFFVFTATALPAQARKSETYAAGGPTPDTSLFYSANDIYAWASAFGPDGRDQYVQARYTFDLVWPLIYALLLVAVITWLLGTFLKPGDKWRRLNLVPFAPLLFDYAENISASIVITRYPATTPVLADVVTVFTTAKWVTLSASFALLVVIAVVAFVRRGTRKSLTTKKEAV